MEVSIRTATIHDSRSIADLSGQLGYSANEQSIRTRLSHLIEDDKNDCVFVAKIGTKMIGWIHGFYAVRVETDPFVEIGGLVVDEDNRGKGIGTLLIKEVIHWSRSIDCNRIRVRSNTKRQESHSFYLKFGFRETKEQKIFDLQLIDE